MFTALPLIAAFILATLTSGSPLDLSLDIHSRQLPPADRYYQIKNNCPTDINLYSAGVLQRSLAAGETTTQYATGFVPGPFYTDANGGSAGGVGSTKAAFWDRVRARALTPQFVDPCCTEFLLYRQRPQSFECRYFSCSGSLRSAWHIARQAIAN